MLKLIRCARWLSTRQIHRRFFTHANINATRRRVRKLTRGGYLRMHQANRMSEALFAIGPEGRRVLERAGIAVGRLERLPPTQIEHFLAVNDVRIAAEQMSALSYFFAYWELPALKWGWPIIPDAVLSVNGRTIAVEYDRGMESLRYFERTKMSVYRRGLDGFPIDVVLVIADRQARVATLTQAIGGGAGKVVVTTIEQVRQEGLDTLVVPIPRRGT